jgi:hypothetical protein
LSPQPLLLLALALTSPARHRLLAQSALQALRASGLLEMSLVLRLPEPEPEPEPELVLELEQLRQAERIRATKIPFEV